MVVVEVVVFGGSVSCNGGCGAAADTSADGDDDSAMVLVTSGCR